MNWYNSLENGTDLMGTHQVPARYTSGHTVGIIAVDLIYPKLPGNVANATTYDYPVLYRKVSFPIEKLFEGAEDIKCQVIAAARELEQEGVRVIVGACGYFAHFQRDVADAVNIPVYLSSLCQLPLIRMGLGNKSKIAVLCASGDNLGEDLLEKIGEKSDGLIIRNIGDLESFAPIRWGQTILDNARLTEELVEVTRKLMESYSDIGAILLECSDLPPYARDIQAVAGVPVYDFITLINWAHHSVAQHRYTGTF